MRKKNKNAVISEIQKAGALYMETIQKAEYYANIGLKTALY